MKREGSHCELFLIKINVSTQYKWIAKWKRTLKAGCFDEDINIR